LLDSQSINVLGIVQTPSTASTERCFHKFRSHGNGSYGTELRQRHNGTAKRQRQNGKGRVETRRQFIYAAGLTTWQHATQCSAHSFVNTQDWADFSMPRSASKNH